MRERLSTMFDAGIAGDLARIQGLIGSGYESGHSLLAGACQCADLQKRNIVLHYFLDEIESGRFIFGAGITAAHIHAAMGNLAFFEANEKALGEANHWGFTPVFYANMADQKTVMAFNTQLKAEYPMTIKPTQKNTPENLYYTALGYLDLAWLYFLKQEDLSALQVAMTSKNLLDENGPNKNDDTYSLLARTYYLIGKIYFEKNDLENSREYLESAIAFSKHVTEKVNLDYQTFFSSLHVLILINKTEEKFVEARNLSLETLEIFDQFPHYNRQTNKRIAEFQEFMFWIHYRGGDFEHAIIFAQASIMSRMRISEKTAGDWEKIVHSFSNLAFAFNMQKKCDEAFDALITALPYLRNIPKEAHRSLSLQLNLLDLIKSWFNAIVNLKLTHHAFSSALKITHKFFLFYLNNLDLLENNGPPFLRGLNLLPFRNYAEKLSDFNVSNSVHVYSTIQAIFTEMPQSVGIIFFSINALLDTNLSYCNADARNALDVFCTGLEKALDISQENTPETEKEISSWMNPEVFNEFKKPHLRNSLIQRTASLRQALSNISSLEALAAEALSRRVEEADAIIAKLRGELYQQKEAHKAELKALRKKESEKRERTKKGKSNEEKKETNGTALFKSARVSEPDVSTSPPPPHFINTSKGSN